MHTAAPSSDETGARTSRYGLWLAAWVAALTLYRTLVLWHLGLDLYVDEAQYWTWAEHLTWGYFSKPPGIALVIAATTAVLGNTAFAVKIGAVLLYPVSTWLVWLIGRRLFDARVGFWSALAFLTLPGVSFSSLIISTDVPFFVCWAAALYAYIRAIDTPAALPPSDVPLPPGGRGGNRPRSERWGEADDRWRWWLLAGVAGGAGLQTKYTMIIFPLSVMLHLTVTPELRDRLRSPRLWAAMLLAALIFAPNLWWNAANGWPTLHHTESISHLQSNPGLHWSSLGSFLGGQFAVMGPILFAAWMVLTLWRPARWWTDRRYWLLACFGLPFLTVICGQALAGRANANWGAMAYVAGTVFVVARLLETGRRRWLWAGIAFNAALMPVAYHFDAWTQAVGITLNRHDDPYKRVRGWARLGEAVSRLAAEHPGTLLLADNRTAIAELRFYVHPQPRQVILWNPGGAIVDQYALTTTMNGKRGMDFLYIGPPGPLAPRVRASFSAVQDLGPLQVAVHPDYALRYHAWLLRDFLGYAPPPAREP